MQYTVRILDKEVFAQVLPGPRETDRFGQRGRRLGQFDLERIGFDRPCDGLYPRFRVTLDRKSVV